VSGVTTNIQVSSVSQTVLQARYHIVCDGWVCLPQRHYIYINKAGIRVSRREDQTPKSATFHRELKKKEKKKKKKQ